ncbi:hypothetical protein M9458_057010 [Cirrhinus mrigala]|uniref:Core-binding (CB) domain-containing protein n=1 Tax=Cirrhinus mrigala TaxID=683832 RepID=A0ABD0MFF5_CIRMR
MSTNITSPNLFPITSGACVYYARARTRHAPDVVHALRTVGRSGESEVSPLNDCLHRVHRCRTSTSEQTQERQSRIMYIIPLNLEKKKKILSSPSVVLYNVTSILTYWGLPWEPNHLRSLEEKANENWRVEFACHATPPYIQVYKMAACNHSLRFLLRSLTVPEEEKKIQANVLLLWEEIAADDNHLLFASPAKSQPECTVVPRFFPGQPAKRAIFSAYTVVISLIIRYVFPTVMPLVFEKAPFRSFPAGLVGLYELGGHAGEEEGQPDGHCSEHFDGPAPSEVRTVTPPRRDAEGRRWFVSQRAQRLLRMSIAAWPASSATLSRTLPSSSRQYRSRLRLLNTSCPGVNPPNCQQLSLRLLVTEGAPPRLLHLLRLRLLKHLRSLRLPCGGIELAVGKERSPLLRGPLQRRHPTSWRSDPETGDLEMGEIVLRGTSTSAPPPPGEGRGPYFIVPKKNGGLRPILDLRVLNRSLIKMPFKMLTPKRIISCIRHQDWFAAIDLKYAYFYVSIFPQHRLFLRFAFKGQAYQYNPPLRTSPVSLRIYQTRGGCPCPALGVGHPNPQLSRRLADNSSLTRSVVRAQGSVASASQSFWASGQLGEEQALPCADHLFSRDGAGLGQHDGTSHGRACAVGAQLSEVVQTQHSGPSKDFSEAPGAYGSCSRAHAAQLASYETASALAPWPSSEMGMAPRHVPGRRHPGMSPPFQPVAGVPLGQVRRHVIVNTDASGTGWGARCNGQAASGFWTGPRLQWHINCLELLAVFLALRRFRRMLHGEHVLVRTDNIYINHQGGLRSHRMLQLACHLLLWSLMSLKSLRAIHIPGELNRATDALSCQLTLPGEWRMETPPPGGPADLEPIRGSSDRSVCLPGIRPLPVILFPDQGSPLHGHPGTQLAPGTHQVRLSPSEPPCTDLVQDPGGRGAGLAGCALLAHPDLVPRTHAPRNSPSLEDSPEEGPSFSGDGHHLAPAPPSVEPSRLASGRDAADLSGLPQAMIDTITQARAPSTRQAYVLRWGLLVDWCSSRREHPQRCSIRVVLSFLQEKLERRLSPSTLKVYVSAIVAYHDAVDGLPLGRHHLIVRFLRGARRLNPPRSHLIPSWDLSVVLMGLCRDPFELLESVELKFLSLKTSLLSRSCPSRGWGTCTLSLSGNRALSLVRLILTFA